MSKISIIIPIYNTGRILNKTLKSISKQTFINFECILVDDGSIDPTVKKICKKFYSKDSRFRYFYKQNQGIEKSRLFGVRMSKYDLLVFCDHDDYYEENALEKLYSSYIKSNADIVSANIYSQRSQLINYRTKQTFNNGINQGIINHSDFIKNYYLNFFGINSFPVSTWSKLYKKNLFDEALHLFNINALEDVLINLQVFPRAKKIHFINDYLYTHVYGGLSTKFSVMEALNNYDEVFPFRTSYLEKYKLPLESLLIEYKNTINQRIDLMIDNKFTESQFSDVINKIRQKEIFKEMILKVDYIKLGNYIPYIVNGNYIDLFYFAKTNNNIKRRARHLLKKIK